MSERDLYLSRRDAGKAMLVGLAAIAGLPFELKYLRQLGRYFDENEFSYLDRAEVTLPLPYALSGVNFNAPFLWSRSQQDVDSFFKFARESSGDTEQSEDVRHTVRLSPENANNFVETELGVFNEKHLDNLETFIDHMPGDFQAILPIIDAYWLLRSDIDIYVYGSSPLCSPYLEDVTSREAIVNSQVSFFIKEFYNKAFEDRMDEFIRRFGAKKNVLLELANEAASPIKGDAGIDMNTFWYRRMIDHARKRGYDKTLFTGIPDPEQIKYGFVDTTDLITTDHIYYPRSRKYPSNIITIGEEFGAPNQIFDLDLPEADDLLFYLITSSLKKGIVEGRAYLGSVFIWHADGKHDDNMDFSPEHYPKTAALLRRLSPKLKQVFSLENEI